MADDTGRRPPERGGPRRGGAQGAGASQRGKPKGAGSSRDSKPRGAGSNRDSKPSAARTWRDGKPPPRSGRDSQPPVARSGRGDRPPAAGRDSTPSSARPRRADKAPAGGRDSKPPAARPWRDDKPLSGGREAGPPAARSSRSSKPPSSSAGRAASPSPRRSGAGGKPLDHRSGQGAAPRSGSPPARAERRPASQPGAKPAGATDWRKPRPQERAGENAARDLRQVQPPAGADPNNLDPEVRQALRSLVPATADRVAAHLVAVGELLYSDPDAALEQARAARAFASRIGVVREAAGLAAYAAGEWHEALAELRAERRLTGSSVHLPVMADCERGLGRPERALELSQSPDLRMVDEAGRVEMLIVASGARRDLNQADAAVVVLQSANLDRDKPRPWSARLWYAYAEALLAAGRRSEAREWFDAVTGVDDGETDAEERLLGLG